jgi:hypothetical protein
MNSPLKSYAKIPVTKRSQKKSTFLHFKINQAKETKVRILQLSEKFNGSEHLYGSLLNTKVYSQGKEREVYALKLPYGTLKESANWGTCISKKFVKILF